MGDSNMCISVFSSVYRVEVHPHHIWDASPKQKYNYTELLSWLVRSLADFAGFGVSVGGEQITGTSPAGSFLFYPKYPIALDVYSPMIRWSPDCTWDHLEAKVSENKAVVLM